MYLMTQPIVSNAVQARGLGCACGGACKSSGVGDFSFGSFVGGMSVPLLLLGGLFVAILVAGPGARARRGALGDERKRHAAAIAEENQKHRAAVSDIKRRLRRLPVGSIYAE